MLHKGLTVNWKLHVVRLYSASAHLIVPYTIGALYSAPNVWWLITLFQIQQEVKRSKVAGVVYQFECSAAAAQP